MQCRLPMRILTAEKIDYADNFADNDWATIAAVCAAGLMPDSWKDDGTSYKDMPINGTNYRVDIIGKGHDEYADGSGFAPFTFQLHDCYETIYPMNSSQTNVGGWTDCVMRKTRLPAIMSLMPSEVQSAIKEVNKLTSAGNTSTTINTTADKLFLLSEIEILGSSNYSASGEGSQYAYYTGNSVVKYMSGSTNTSNWWSRSPYIKNSTIFCSVTKTGTFGGNNANDSHGVAFAFCF